MKPPLVASPFTLLLIVIDERQFSMLTVLPSSTRPIKPPVNLADEVTVPAVCKLRNLAFAT